jgi:hypothetical protein
MRLHFVPVVQDTCRSGPCASHPALCRCISPTVTAGFGASVGGYRGRRQGSRADLQVAASWQEIRRAASAHRDSVKGLNAQLEASS